MTHALPPAILLMGPTASGKTQLALDLLAAGPFEIISVDSAMVYKGMDIGTAKPDAAILAQAPHRLIDFLEPEIAYSAADFRNDALAAMQEISAAGKIPLLVGGTMLYFKVLLEGLADMPPADPQVRAEIEAEAAEKGWPAIHAELAKHDPITAARLKSTDSQRLQRALEVWRVTGKSMAQWHAEQQPPEPLPWQLLQYALLPPERPILHERIERRFDEMLTLGFVEEVERLKQRPSLHATMPSMRSVGYSQIWSYLEGEYDYAEMRLRGIYATRQLAKRQITWLNQFPDTSRLTINDKHLVGNILQSLDKNRKV